MFAFFASLITALPGFFSGLFGTVNSVTAALSNEKIAQIQATSDEEKLRIQTRIDMLQARQAVLIADGGHSTLDLWIRAFLAFPVIAVTTKILVWDKALGQWTGGHTDALGADLWHLLMVVYGFYFVYASATGAARILRK